MCSGESCHPAQRLPIGGGVLPGQSRHQIYVDVVKACRSRRLIRVQKLIIGVDPSDPAKLLVRRRLQADAEPIDPRFPVAADTVCRSRPGIHLHRDLRILRERIALSDLIHQPLHLPRLEQRRRSPAEKDRLYRVVPARLCARSQLLF